MQEAQRPALASGAEGYASCPAAGDRIARFGGSLLVSKPGSFLASAEARFINSLIYRPKPRSLAMISNLSVD
jgi:hypothetical protein